MRTTSIDRRTALKIALAGVAAPLPLCVDAAPIAPAHSEPSARAVVAPAMCADLHIADTPVAPDVS